MGPINQNAMARGLLDWFGDDRPVVDRATLLPIGQYEDGGLTFAWPGFLKDAWEGAQRTYLDAGNVPVPDAAPGTRWSSNVDALNAASIAPATGLLWGRAAGMSKVAPEAASTSTPGLPVKARTTPTAFDGMFGGKSVFDAKGKLVSYADVVRRPDGIEIGNIMSFDRGKGYATGLVDDLFQEFPGQRISVSPMTDAGRTFFSRYGVDGERTISPRKGNGVALYANDSRAALPALMAQPQGLLGGEPQPALPPLFASAEPYLLERPTEPVMGPFEMPGRWDFPFDLDRQKWQDERYQSPIDLPAPEDQFRPTFRPFAGLMR